MRALGLLMEGFTSDKPSRKADYLGRVEFLEAYLFWYLPHNLLKFSSLLPRLNLEPSSQLTDFGSGPLTVPLAFWLLKKDWRALDLGWTLVEPYSKALDSGLKLLEHVVSRFGQTLAWKFSRVRGRLGVAIQRKASLVVCSHVLNEVHDTETNLVHQLLRDVLPGAHLLLVEPGTRLASRRLVKLRGEFLKQKLHILAPCTHLGPCPAPGLHSHDHFCHFPGQSERPRWMEEVADQLGTQYNTRPVSFLHVQASSGPSSSLKRARVISTELPIPQLVHAHYLCAQEGLLVGHGREGNLWGEVVDYRLETEHDPKTRRPRAKIIF